MINECRLTFPVKNTTAGESMHDQIFNDNVWAAGGCIATYTYFFTHEFHFPDPDRNNPIVKAVSPKKKITSDNLKSSFRPPPPYGSGSPRDCEMKLI